MSDWTAQSAYSPVLIAQATHPETGAHSLTPPSPGAHESAAEAETSPWVFYGYSVIAFLAIIVLAIAGARRLKLVPQGLQNLLEMAVESLYGIPELVMGERGRQYAPFLSTFFLYILMMNLSGLIPWLKSGTASLSITLGLSIVAFISVQYFGFRAHGIKYLTHFVGPVPWMAFLIFPLELLSELIRPVSLAIRLYGNINGEEKVIEALAMQLSPFVAVVMLPLQILTSILQAFVFTLLVTVYISLATEKHEAEHGETHETPAHA
ncbi:MAG: F0F1 ATP synthase subunit A [Armatimonadota bacterium]